VTQTGVHRVERTARSVGKGRTERAGGYWAVAEAEDLTGDRRILCMELLRDL
jgi:hypothetical protein